VLALPFILGLPDPATAFLFLAWVVLITGVNHADGLADLGDAAVVHGDPAERRDVMKDTTVGVGAVLALGTGLLGLALAGLALAELPTLTAVGVVLTAEVGAKLAVAIQVVTGEASHEGFGSRFVDRAASGDRPAARARRTPSRPRERVGSGRRRRRGRRPRRLRRRSPMGRPPARRRRRRRLRRDERTRSRRRAARGVVRVDALVMCGGLGSRLDGDVEKPLVEVGGARMVDRVVAALVGSPVDDVYAVTSPNAPATAATSTSPSSRPVGRVRRRPPGDPR